MAFVRIVDTENNEHYVRYESIVDVRNSASGTFIDIDGVESPIFVKKRADEVVELLTTMDVYDRQDGI